MKSTVSKKLLYFNFKQIMRTYSLYAIFGDMEILLRTHKFRNLNYDMSNPTISNNVSQFCTVNSFLKIFSAPSV